MAWEGSDRRSELPPDWPVRVAAVKERDRGQCTWKLPSKKRCPRPGTDVDHRKPGSDHALENLQLLCGAHHAQKTATEGYQAKRARRRRRRPLESQPGRLR